jgi:actin-like ATPase involved in cell morphogenesis/sugar lactone lactonase YvrE
MSYALGVDIGTTFSAAAVYRQGRAEMVSLGYHSPLVPSAVLITSTNETLVGDAALRRGQSEPERLARFFKRRIGDSVPMILGGSPLSSETLTARLLRAVIDRVVEQQGEPPGRIAVTRPANWGPFKQDRFDQAIRLADLTDVIVLTEPEAAALAYAAEQRIPDGAVVAVYDLGGGTFDATMLRRTGDRFTVTGEPEGIERLGGIDFDAAVFEHVRQSLYGAIEALDDDDPVTLRSITRLRNECIEAKEALSSDTQVSIPVVLPGLNTEVRLTRSEMEGMIRPSLDDSIASLRRAAVSARVEPADIDRVLLVGGSSRIPLVAQMVGSAFGRPVALDAHPKHAVALGAALVAGGEGIEGRAIGATAPAPPGLVAPLVTPAASGAEPAAVSGADASGAGNGTGSGSGAGTVAAAGVAAAGLGGAGAAALAGSRPAGEGGGPSAPTPPAGHSGAPDAPVPGGDQPFAFTSGPAGPHAAPQIADGSLPTARSTPEPPAAEPPEGPAGPPSGDAWPTPPPGSTGAPSGDAWPTPPPGSTGAPSGDAWPTPPPGSTGAPSGDAWPTPPPGPGGPSSGDAWAPPAGPDAPTRIDSGDGWAPAPPTAPGVPSGDSWAASAAGPGFDDTQVESGDTWRVPETSPSGPPGGDTWTSPPPTTAPDERGRGRGGRRAATGLAAGAAAVGAGTAAAGASPGTGAPAEGATSWSSPGSGSYPPGGGPAAPGGTDERGGRKWLLPAAAIVAVVALGAGGILAFSGGGDDDDGTDSDTTADTSTDQTADTSGTTVATDGGGAAAMPTDLEVGQVIDLPSGGDGIDLDGQGRLWVATLKGGSDKLMRYDDSDLEGVEIPLDLIGEDTEPLGVHFAYSSIWVTLRGTNEVLRIDPDQASADVSGITGQFPTGGPAVQVTSGADYIWAVAQGPGGTGTGHIYRIDPGTGDMISTEIDEPRGVVVDPSKRVWATFGGNQLQEYDLNLEPVGGPVTVGAGADEVAFAGDFVWTANRDAGTVSYVDPVAHTQVGVVNVGGNPAGLRGDGDRVWIVDTAEDVDGVKGRLVLVDASTQKQVTEEALGTRPLGLTVDGDTVWVTMFDNSEGGHPEIERVDALA